MVYDKGMEQGPWNINWEKERENEERREKKKEKINEAAEAEYGKQKDEEEQKDKDRFDEMIDVWSAKAAGAKVQGEKLEVPKDKEISRRITERAEAALFLGNIRKRLKADPEWDEIPREEAAFNLSTFGTIIDSFKNTDAPPYATEKARQEFRDHYGFFYFPGNVGYSERHHQYEIRKPSGLGYEIQQIMIEKARFSINSENVGFFEPGKEDKIAVPNLRNALEVYFNERNHSSIGTTWFLFKKLWEGEFFEHLNPKEKVEMMGLAIFADLIEKGKWLDFAKIGFFDDREISLFKINRKLSKEQLTNIMNDFLTGEMDDMPQDFGAMNRRVQDIIVKKASAPLSKEFIEKRGLQELVNRHMRESREAEAYLKSGKNSFGSRFGKVIFVEGVAEKLPAPLLAIAEDAPQDERTRRPLWKKINGYFETNEDHLLAYLPVRHAKEIFWTIANQAKKNGLNPQMSEISGWMKLFISFRGKEDDQLINLLRERLLGIEPRGLRRKQGEQKSPQAGKKKEKVLVER